MILVREIVSMLPALRDHARLPEESLQSYPVPVDFWGACVEFFFVPWKGRPPNAPVLYPPIQRMAINASTGKAVRVTPVGPKDYGLDLDSKAPLGEHRLDPPLEVPDFLALQQGLYSDLDRLLRHFPQMPADPGPEARAAASQFKQTFAQIAQKPLLPFYRATNPAFFDWIDRLASEAGTE